MLFEYLVAVARLRVQPHGIRETGAAAALDANAETALLRRNAILFEEFADFQRGTLGQVDLRDVRTCDFCCHGLRLQTSLLATVPSRGAACCAPTIEALATATLRKLSATPFRAPELQRRAFSSSHRWRP